MTKIDDLLQRRAKQVILTVVARLAHRSPPTANVEGITNRPNRESETQENLGAHPAFLQNRLTCSGQIIAIDQSLPNSSRTTTWCWRHPYRLPLVRLLRTLGHVRGALVRRNRTPG